MLLQLWEGAGRGLLGLRLLVPVVGVGVSWSKVTGGGSGGDGVFEHRGRYNSQKVAGAFGFGVDTAIPGSTSPGRVWRYWGLDHVNK